MVLIFRVESVEFQSIYPITVDYSVLLIARERVSTLFVISHPYTPIDGIQDPSKISLHSGSKLELDRYPEKPSFTTSALKLLPTTAASFKTRVLYFLSTQGLWKIAQFLGGV